jgi:hypothetical protein
MILHLKKITEKGNLNAGQYIELTKRFSKYDLHPCTADISIPGQPGSLAAKDVNNFVFGVIAHEVLKIQRNEAQLFTSAVAKDAAKNKTTYINEYFWKNRFLFLSLAYDIQQGKAKFYSQCIKSMKDSYLRVDDVYKENKKYWKFRLPKDHLFNCSMTTDILKKIKFSKEEHSILQRMCDYNVYAAYKEGDCLVFVVSGVLDNTMGFIYSLEPPKKENFSPTLHITKLEPAGENFYLYVSD